MVEPLRSCYRKFLSSNLREEHRAYMDSGYGCPCEWCCLKIASQGEGALEGPFSVIAFVKCECPGCTVAPNQV